MCTSEDVTIRLRKKPHLGGAFLHVFFDLVIYWKNSLTKVIFPVYCIHVIEKGNLQKIKARSLFFTV
jgi:hypothetical protein